MPRKTKQKQGPRGPNRNAGTTGTGPIASLGGGIGNTIVAVPRTLQQTTREFVRGVDALGTNSSIFQFQSTSALVVGLSKWLTTLTSDWTNIANNWDEFRPVALRIRGMPAIWQQFSTEPFLMALDVDGLAPVTPTPSLVAAYRTSKILSCKDDWELKYQIPQEAAALWYNINNPTAWASQLVAAPTTTMPTSTSFLALSSILFEFEVLLRGRR